MKGFWSYFWIIYMLFFAIPFPMLLYYNINYGVIGSDGGTYPWLALGYLALSLVLWFVLIRGWFRKWIWMTFVMKNNIHRLLKEGVKKEARVIKSKTGKPGARGTVPTEMTVSFRNFVGTEITEEIAINDSKPELRRYEEGKTVQLMIDDKLKTVPHLTIDEVTSKIKTGRMILLCFLWLLVAALILGYYGLSYKLENSGRGWRFLTFYHPLLLCPVILLTSRIGFSKLFRLFLGPPANSLQLKYYGVRTDAQIISAEQTGTYINEQPQVRFELQYNDDMGRGHTTTLKKIVPLIDLGMVKQGPVKIFYLKDKPEQAAFADVVED